MIIRIEIDCETEAEIYAHLRKIEQQVRRSFKKTPSPKRLIVLDDSNCYGDHMVRIKNTGKDETV